MNSENGEQEFDPFAIETEKKTPRKSGGGVAWLALLLAIAAALFSGYQWWSDRLTDSAGSDREAALQSLQRAQSGLEQTLGSLESRIAAAEQSNATGEINNLNSGVDSLRGRVAEIGLESANSMAAVDAIETSLLSLRERIASAETSIAALAVRGDSPGKRMDLSEVEYLLRLASERLQLFGDPRSADQALVLADERLTTLDDPLYLPVRQRIARARQALADIPVPDAVLLTGRIGALQAAIPALPFPGDRPVAIQAATEEEAAGLWARFKRAMSGLVTVRRKVPEDDIVLSLEDRDYVRQGLWLQLETARLAVMRSDAAAFGLSLQRAADTLSARFERDSGEVANAIAEIESLRQIPVSSELPDISAPWAQLRLLREGRSMEGAESAPAEPAINVPAGSIVPDLQASPEPTVDPGSETTEPAAEDAAEEAGEEIVSGAVDEGGQEAAEVAVDDDPEAGDGGG